MKRFSKLLCAAVLGVAFATADLLAQTDGASRLQATILDYNGSGTKHWTVVWVATASGTFIKTLWKQGPTITASHWSSHCSQWYSAKAGSTALDGYTSATAQTYTGTNSPVILTWDSRDANNNLVADGAYKFWIQYAEDNGQGPYTTSGLLWTKGLSATTNTYPNQGANFANLQVIWAPTPPPPVAPTITSAAPPATGTVGVAYSFSCTATGTVPITFAAAGLPTGLTISPAGVISGRPTLPGTFPGTITASNGTPPNATQAFSIVIGLAPLRFTAVRANGTNLEMSADGPADGICFMHVSTDLSQPAAQWTRIATNAFDSSGHFGFTNAMEAILPQRFFRLEFP